MITQREKKRVKEKKKYGIEESITCDTYTEPNNTDSEREREFNIAAAGHVFIGTDGLTNERTDGPTVYKLIRVVKRRHLRTLDRVYERDDLFLRCFTNLLYTQRVSTEYRTKVLHTHYYFMLRRNSSIYIYIIYIGTFAQPV